jgi:hypothetical protein
VPPYSGLLYRLSSGVSPGFVAVTIRVLNATNSPDICVLISVVIPGFGHRIMPNLMCRVTFDVSSGTALPSSPERPHRSFQFCSTFFLFSLPSAKDVFFLALLLTRSHLLPWLHLRSPPVRDFRTQGNISCITSSAWWCRRSSL